MSNGRGKTRLTPVRQTGRHLCHFCAPLTHQNAAKVVPLREVCGTRQRVRYMAQRDPKQCGVIWKLHKTIAPWSVN